MDAEQQSKSNPNLAPQKFTVSALLIVFLQTFVVATLVLAIPLGIAFDSWNSSNQLSYNTGAELASSLQEKIQTATSINIRNDIEIYLDEIESVSAEYARVIDSGNQALFDYDGLFKMFLLIQRRKGPFQFIYFASASTDGYFVGVQKMPDNVPTEFVLVSQKLSAGTADCLSCSNTFKENTRFSYAITDAENFVVNKTAFKEQAYFPHPRGWFQEGLTQSSSGVVYVGPGVFKSTFAVGYFAVYPFFDANNNVSAVMSMNVPFENISTNLRAMKKTPNAFIYCMDLNGKLIGISTNDTFITEDNQLMEATQMQHPNVAKTGEHLKSLLGEGQDYSSLPQKSNYQLDDLIFEHEIIERDPKFVIVSGTLRKDFMGELDTVLDELSNSLVQKVMETVFVAIGILLFVVSLSMVMTYFSVVKPLRYMAEVMSQASRFKFQAVREFKNPEEGGNAVTRSIIREFHSMQLSFFAMIQNFAEGIKNNNQLKSANDYSSGLRSEGARSGFE